MPKGVWGCLSIHLSIYIYVYVRIVFDSAFYHIFHSPCVDSPSELPYVFSPITLDNVLSLLRESLL